MKRSLLFISLAAAAAACTAQSSVSISGTIRSAVAAGNGGTTPIDGQTGDRWALNDLSSMLHFSGREDLGGGLYAGFQLSTFVHSDDGTTSTPFWGAKSVVKLGGPWGEFYAGRALTPAALMVLFADPWYWDASAAQVGWQVHQANYTSTAYVRTDNTLGYVSPKLGGWTLSLAASAGEKVKSSDVGASLTYSEGPVWFGVAHDSSHGFFNSPTRDRMTTVVGAYDFGVVRPMAAFTSSRVGGINYKSWSLAATAPVGGAGLLKAQYSRLNDFDTSTVARESLSKLGLGYQHTLSKRTAVFAQWSHAKAQTRSATNTLELGIEHNF